MSKIVTFIGGGDLGQALAGLLADRADVRVWDINPKRSSDHALTLSQAITEAEVIFITTPAVAVPAVAAELSTKIHLEQKIVLCSKGLTGSGQNVWEFAKVMLPHSPKVLISGPMLAPELVAGKGGAGLVAGDRETARVVAALFGGTGLELIETDADPEALAWVGVFKNIYALGLGYVRAQGAGSNQIGFLITLCLQEMNRWLQLVTDTDGSLAWSLAGLGDLVTTGLSSESKNARAGKMLATGNKDLATVPEGVHSLECLASRIGDLSQFPLAESLLPLVRGERPKDNPWLV